MTYSTRVLGLRTLIRSGCKWVTFLVVLQRSDTFFQLRTLCTLTRLSLFCRTAPHSPRLFPCRPLPSVYSTPLDTAWALSSVRCPHRHFMVLAQPPRCWGPFPSLQSRFPLTGLRRCCYLSLQATGKRPPGLPFALLRRGFSGAALRLQLKENTHLPFFIAPRRWIAGLIFSPQARA
jgi:hypothetical protein